MNPKIKTCYRCKGYEPCRLIEDAYATIREDRLCVWKDIINQDVNKINNGIECLTFPDIKDLKENRK